ncbi:TlpA family protein disulfide reductase [Dinghuibacter silviterrae]|uniref:Thiol-disulfide isomerase/thioredoxin n=1 Tax=Dinghuibacter silviterrae TaxID=1539049 RepID=A0A4R8DHU1_9BACT|nr:TlpA disulfide reductase family protein [Dinghuibacter silviterrae]TDW97299.1 thiol-disulfide isomerase/thioredoxin [Dinghuibacter silviterrae]
MHFTLLLLALLHDTLLVNPATPQPGTQVTVHYTSEDKALAKKRELAGGLFSFNKKNNIQAQDLSFHRDGDGWTATGSVPDTATAIVLSVFDPAGKPLKVVASGLNGADGQPLRDGYKALAEAYGNFGKFAFGMTPDKDRADGFQQQYWASLTEAPTAFYDKVTYYLAYKKDTTRALKEISSLPLDTSATESTYTTAAFIAGRQLKDKPLSDILTNLFHQKYPSGDWLKMDFYRKESAAVDVEEKKKILDAYKKAFPNEPPAPGGGMTIGRAMNQGIIYAYAEKGDVNEAVKRIPPDLRGSSLAALYNNIAWSAVEKGQSLAEATALSKASLDTLTALEASGEGKPAYYTKTQYVQELKNSYALYADTYAYLLYKTGDYKNAFSFESIAMKIADADKSIVGRYYLMMEKVEKPSKVIAGLSTYIAKGDYDSSMVAEYKRLYNGSGSADDALAALESKAKAAKQAEMIKTILNEPAAHFVLRDLKGDKVSLDSYRGKTVVLDFWATWCGPCKASFPAMQKLVDKHKADNNVVLLFIDTWENADDKNKNASDFAAANPYTFHILMDNDNDVVGKYKVEGIPTKFVIDPNGNLRFKAVGFNGDTQATVEEMESMIQLATKP